MDHTSMGTMDPILARYMNLKRQMDGRSASLPPGGAAGGSYHSNLQNASVTAQHHPPERYGTPNSRRAYPMGGVANASYGATTAADPRAVLQSPRAGTADANASGYGHISPSLKRRLAVRAEAEAQHMSAQVAESRRMAADTETHEIRMAVKQQQLELDDALGKLEASERQLKAARDALERSEDARSEVELQLSSAMRDTEMARNNTKAQGISNAKVLEGKIAALQSELANREEGIKSYLIRQQDLEAEIRKRDAAIEQLTAGLYSKERSAGESSLATEALKSEIGRLRKALEDSSVDARLRAGRYEQSEAETREREMAMERAALAHREELRAVNRKLSQLDVEYCAATEQVRELETANSRLEAEVRNLRVTLEATEASHRDTATKLETIRTRSAQDSIIVDQTKYDLEQCRQAIANLRKEGSDKDQRISELERLAAKGEEDHRVRTVLEAQVTSQHAQLDHYRDEQEHSKRRVEELLRRIDALSKEADTIPHLKERVNELVGLADAKNAAIDKQRQVEDSLREALSVASTEGRLLADHKQQLTTENHRLDAELKSKNIQLDELTDEVKKKNALYGEIEGLGAMLRDRDQRIASLATDIQRWQAKCRELDEDIDTLLDVKRQFDELVANHRALYAQLEDRNHEFDTLKHSSEELAMQLGIRDQEAREYNALLLESDAKANKLGQQLADKNAVESRLRQTSSELTAVRSELATEKDKKDEARHKAQQREEQLALERSARAEAEDRSNRLQEELSDSQVQLGKATVRLEGFDKECRRLTIESEAKAKQLDSASEELLIVRRDLQQTLAELKELKFRDEHNIQRFDTLSAELAKLQASNVELSALARAGDERAIICERLTEKCHSLEFQAQSLEARLADAVGELSERNQQVVENKTAIGRLQAELAGHEKTNQRLSEAKLLADKQLMIVDTLEREDAAKSRQLMEKEREMSRLREKVTLLTADLETERTKKRSLENRVKELERECERASTLDGQVAGLSMVVQQRSRALEEEQATSKELRARLARVAEHRASSSRSPSVAGSGPDSVDSRLAVKDEIIRQLEAEERRRQGIIEDLRDQLRTAEEQLHQAEAALRDTKGHLAANDATWGQRYGKLEASFTRTLAEAKDTTALDMLQAELKDTRKRAVVLEEELREKERDLRAARLEIAALPDKRDVARRAEAGRIEAQQSAKEREIGLAVARAEERRGAANTSETALQTSSASLSYADGLGSIGGTSVDDELAQWREARRKVAPATSFAVQPMAYSNVSPVRGNTESSPSPSASGAHTLHSPR